jgi:membrane-associated phospholipid phosphatase
MVSSTGFPQFRPGAEADTAPLGPAPGSDARRSTLPWALLAAALCVAAMAAVWVFAELVPATHLRDAILLNDFTSLGRPRIDNLANHLLKLLSPGLYTLWALMIVAVALLRRRPRVALVVAVVLAAAPLSAELLKPLLAHAHARIGYQWIGAASWPSGHATAASTLVVCALLVAPSVLRPTLAVLGLAFMAAVGCALLILAWHMPSDVLGGYLLAALYGSLAVAALSARRGDSTAVRARQRRRGRRGSTATRSPHPLHERG